METNLKEIKCDIIGILTTSKKNLSVKDLQKEYRLLLGSNINYKMFGYHSVIELLQRLSDVITLPDNPDENSIILYNVGDKCKHIKMLIDKQRSNSKNRSKKSSSSNQLFPNRNNNNSYSNNNRSCLSFGFNNSPKNNQQQSPVQNRINNLNQSPIDRNNIHRQRHWPDNNNLKSQSPPSVNQFGILSPGVLTNGLRLHVENVLRENQMRITLDEFIKTVKKHQDFPFLNTETVSRAIPLFDSFIKIKEGYVFLKDTVENNKNVEVELAINVSTPNSISEKSDISLQSSYRIPQELYRNLARIFNAYNAGFSVKQFELLYNILFNTVFDSTICNFETTIDLFKYLKRSVFVYNNIVYRKSMIKFHNDGLQYFDKELKSKIKQTKEINQTMVSKDISLYVEWEIFCSNQDSTEKQVKLAYVHDPTFFYLNLSSNVTNLYNLMTKMKIFYNGVYGKNYVALQHQINVGMVYATSFKSNQNQMKTWLRVRVLKLLGSQVKVIHVDHGMTDLIPITEFKFLKKEFAVLPCQAINCCLTFCDKLKVKTGSLTDAFLKICKSEPLWMVVDNNYIFDSFCDSYQILHVTLYQKMNVSALSDYLHNVNYELLKDHVNN